MAVARAGRIGQADGRARREPFIDPGTMAARLTCSKNRVQVIAATMAPIVFLVSAAEGDADHPEQAEEITVPRQSRPTPGGR